MRQDRYDCGWNDLANGILGWPETINPKWQTPFEWARHCWRIAQARRQEGPEDGYFQGVIEACEDYIRTGKIERRGG
jgi:hypothetical protein